MADDSARWRFVWRAVNGSVRLGVNGSLDGSIRLGGKGSYQTRAKTRAAREQAELAARLVADDRVLGTVADDRVLGAVADDKDFGTVADERDLVAVADDRDLGTVADESDVATVAKDRNLGDGRRGERFGCGRRRSTRLRDVAEHALAAPLSAARGSTLSARRRSLE